MLHALKQHIPKSFLRTYHWVLAHLATRLYGYPSRKLIVIGVTGTNGKSSTVQFIGQLLMRLGERIGWTTTVSFRVGEHEVINSKKMTMLGRFQTHRMLREMVKDGCRYAVVETSSQGIEQFRHIGIDYDALVFTNLTPEHIEAHGGFENYKEAKRTIFREIAIRSPKTLHGKTLDRTIVVNANDEHAQHFAEHDVEHVVGWYRKDLEHQDLALDAMHVVEKVSFSSQGTKAQFDGRDFSTPFIGGYYLENVVSAITTVVSLGFSVEDVLSAAADLDPIPGRLELFTHKGATIIVDYAYEPYALRALYEAIEPLRANRIIHVTGSAGGGRDVARREQIGRLAAERDDIVIVTNEDPYDEDPWVIINDVADGALAAGMKENATLFRILDREEAIQKAISLAGEGDVVLITGKGSEPVMAVAGGAYVKSDDRAFVRKAIDV